MVRKEIIFLFMYQFHSTQSSFSSITVDLLCKFTRFFSAKCYVACVKSDWQTERSNLALGNLILILETSSFEVFFGALSLFYSLYIFFSFIFSFSTYFLIFFSPCCCCCCFKNLSLSRFIVSLLHFIIYLLPFILEHSPFSVVSSSASSYSLFFFFLIYIHFFFLILCFVSFNHRLLFH